MIDIEKTKEFTKQIINDGIKLGIEAYHKTCIECIDIAFKNCCHADIQSIKKILDVGKDVCLKDLDK